MLITLKQYNENLLTLFSAKTPRYLRKACSNIQYYYHTLFPDQIRSDSFELIEFIHWCKVALYIFLLWLVLKRFKSPPSRKQKAYHIF